MGRTSNPRFRSLVVEKRTMLSGGTELRIRKGEVQLKQTEKQFWGLGLHCETWMGKVYVETILLGWVTEKRAQG